MVEVRQVDARAENPPAGVFLVGGGRPAEDADPDLVVEQDEVDGDLERSGRVVVLGVEKGVILDRDQADVALAVDANRAEVDVARPRSEPSSRASAPPVGCDIECMRWKPERGWASTWATKTPCADLESLLVLLEERSLSLDRGARGELLGEQLGRGVDELRDAQLPPQSVGEVRRRSTPSPVGGAPATRRLRGCEPRHGVMPPARVSITRDSLPPSERGTVPGRNDPHLHRAADAVLDQVRDPRPRSSWSA